MALLSVRLRFDMDGDSEQSFATGGTGIPACHVTGKMPVPPEYNLLDKNKEKRIHN